MDPFLLMKVSLQLARPHNPEAVVIAQFKYGGKKRRLGLDVTVPCARWNKGKQRLKILGSMPINEQKECAAQCEIILLGLRTPSQGVQFLLFHTLTILCGLRCGAFPSHQDSSASRDSSIKMAQNN